MKNYIVSAAMLFVIAITQPAKSQVSVNINIGIQPLWGPVGYDYVEYYYLPDYGVYYYVPTAQFVYFDAGQWLFVPVLPPRFGVINYYTCYKVVINQPKAYLYYETHRVKYAGYKGKGAKQVVIRDSREPKYYVVKGHPYYGKTEPAKAAPSKKISTTTKPAPAKNNPKMQSAPIPRKNPSPVPHRGNSGGNNKGGGHGKGGGKPK